MRLFCCSFCYNKAMVRLNQFSIVDKSADEMRDELMVLGFDDFSQLSEKEMLRSWLTKAPVEMTGLQASADSSLEKFLSADKPLSWEIFYCIALQLQDFIVNFEFQPDKSLEFAKTINLPQISGKMNTENLLHAIYLLMSSRGKNGMTLVEKWISEDLLSVDNHFHFFNDLSLATFDTSHLTREVVYVETPVDTFQTGKYDLVKVQIIRPTFDGQLPVVMTASPYHMGTNDIAADKKTHEMAALLTEKKSGHIVTRNPEIQLPDYPKLDAPLTDYATEHFTHSWTSSLNDYLLARGFASVYVGGVGTMGSDGMQTSGDYQQIASMRAVIDWLNGRARAFVDRNRSAEIRSGWANGHVATTGKSYLGTMSYGLATTGVEGLDVILAEAGISSWYDYYRENGLVRSPGGFPGEDLDELAELTYSRNMTGSDFLKNNARYQEELAKMSVELDRKSGDYNDFWAARNYLPHANNVHCDVLIEHGLQDWNVQPSQAYHFWHALPETVTKHAILHRGAHIYANAWQSLDYSEIINHYFTAKLLTRPLTMQLPTIILQENSKYESWTTVDSWDAADRKEITLGSGKATFENHYSKKKFVAFSKNYRLFKEKLYSGRANAVTIDLPMQKNLFIKGEIQLQLQLKTTDSKGILSAQLLDFGNKKRLADSAAVLESKVLDRGRNFQLEHLSELPLTESPHQLMTQGFTNLQNVSLTEIRDTRPEHWLTVNLTLQPQFYQLAKGDTLRLLLYSTDFEHTIRDNRKATTTIDLAKSRIILPIEK